MTLWLLLLIVCAAGALGGLVNSCLSDNMFFLPKSQDKGDGTRISQPGILVSILIGAVAASLSWGLYGPFSMAWLIAPMGTGTASQIVGITLSTLVSAVLVGVGGTRWLTSEVDKRMLKTAASLMASVPADATAAQRMLNVKPAEALKIAVALQNAFVPLTAGANTPVGATLGA